MAMEGYRVEVEINMSWPDWIHASKTSIEAMEKKYGYNNITTTQKGMFFQILVKQ